MYRILDLFLGCVLGVLMLIVVDKFAYNVMANDYTKKSQHIKVKCNNISCVERVIKAVKK